MTNSAIFLSGVLFAFQLLMCVVLLIGKWNIGDFEVTDSKLKYPLLVLFVFGMLLTLIGVYIN
ncbi:hypothetical protein [Enterococcus sp. HY326]|uniref:hypothetical protein n=1 Tax=Enterococcus sp. HY326 TaxID=2971265 RepID=UPI00223EFDE5|nr:hypothetical protein [Enterococcus sp. HY326]